MTEDYKKNLLDYVTGLLNQESPKNTDFMIKNINEIDYTADSWQFIINEFENKSVAINGILESDKYDIFIMYGGYIDGTSASDSNGFLIYLDRKGTPLKLTKLTTKGILFLKFDETNNRVYGCTSNRSTNWGANDLFVEGYFVYYNNLFLTYDEGTEVRQTYSTKIYTASLTGLTFSTADIIKDPNNSYYLIFCSHYQNSGNRIIELKINVGSPNELTTWNLNSAYGYYAYFGSYSNGVCDFKLISINNQNNKFYLITKNNTSLSYSELTSDISITYSQLSGNKVNSVYVNENNIYFVINKDWTDENDNSKCYSESYLLRYNGTKIENIYKTDLTEGIILWTNLTMLNILKDIDNSLYVLRYISNYDNNETEVKLLNLSNHSTITENDWINIGTYSYVYRDNIYNQQSILRRNYNISNMFLYSGYFRRNYGAYSGIINGFQLNIKTISPINGYVGDPYVGVDALVPKYSNLYSNGSLVFSRNLYNITKQNNSTMSSVEIPSTYLNDSTITQNDLLSQTNLQMNSDNTEWNKNIYEVVDLNYINTISIIDEDTNTPYINGAIKLNNSVTDGGNTNYQNTPCNKYRINYTDTTTYVDDLSWTPINDTTKETEISFYVDKNMLSIDLISNDESTIYLTIPLEVTIGKNYTIKQKVRIGEKPSLMKLQYNNEDVLYNNEPVMVYLEE